MTFYTSMRLPNESWASLKTVNDPCPAGWRVPDGAKNGVWSKSIGSSSSFNYTYHGTNEGINFSGKFGSDQTIWYPASGARYNSDGSLAFVGSNGYYWSASPNGNNGISAYILFFSSGGNVNPATDGYSSASCFSVRCLQESK